MSCKDCKNNSCIKQIEFSYITNTRFLISPKGDMITSPAWEGWERG